MYMICKANCRTHPDFVYTHVTSTAPEFEGGGGVVWAGSGGGSWVSGHTVSPGRAVHQPPDVRGGRERLPNGQECRRPPQQLQCEHVHHKTPWYGGTHNHPGNTSGHGECIIISGHKPRVTVNYLRAQEHNAVGIIVSKNSVRIWSMCLSAWAYMYMYMQQSMCAKDVWHLNHCWLMAMWLTPLKQWCTSP